MATDCHSLNQDFWGKSPSFVGLENFDAWAELDESNQLVTRRIYGDSVDQPIARVDAGGTAWYHQDVRGSVVALTDGNGTVQTQYAYDGFGNATVSGSTAFADEVRYTARFFDNLTGLQHNRARWYDPQTGRWISEDPMGFGAGDANLYRYAGNGQTNASDPSGMAISEIGDPVVNIEEINPLRLNPKQFESLRKAGVIVEIAEGVWALKLGGRLIAYKIEKVPDNGMARPKHSHFYVVDRIFPGTYPYNSAKQLYDLQCEADSTALADGIVTFTFHMLPGGAAAGFIVLQGDWANGGLSLLGDAGAILTLGGTRMIRVGMAAEGGVLAVRGYQLGRDLAGGEFGDAAGTAGEIVFRLVTLRSGRHRLDVALRSQGQSQLQRQVELALQRAKAATKSGPNYGMRLHAALKNEISKLGRHDLRPEISFKDGELVRYGKKGSIRVDIILGPADRPLKILDLKTGGAKLTPERIREIRCHLPDDWQHIPIEEIR